FTLLEARHRRASFLQVAAAAMGLRNVAVRAQFEPRDRAAHDVVTARAFGAPAVALKIAAGALKPGGRMILYANPAQRLETDAGSAYGLNLDETYEYWLERGVIRMKRVLLIWTHR
ncbi:MAG: RsmG family class I SAM-dependent methyltransferase, partial [Candidatus Binataceae bacterium]